MEPNPIQALTQAVKAQAYRLGFTLVGVTTPEPPPHLDVFNAWLAQGRHGTMDYLAVESARQKRADPAQVLPGCRSILVLGTPYPATVDNPGEDGITGKIAAYAQGRDYHDVLPERMQALIQFIEIQTGQAVPNRYYTDTGPVLERELAQRAGLGWIGKNTCLINPRQGSYFLLSEIFLGIELEMDQPIRTDHCGSCRRCIEACPTGCILPDRTLDARRCISYLTIENKGPIPLDLRSRLEGWVFGCDICQQVCPWNRRFARQTGDPAFQGTTDRRQPDLLEVLRLSPEEFNLRFKGSPIKRAKRRGLLRSAAAVLGTLGEETPIEHVTAGLAAALTDSEALVRGHAAWALGEIGSLQAQPALEQALQRENDSETAAEIRLALERLQ